MNDTLKALADKATETTEPFLIINEKVVSATLIGTYRGSKRKPVTLWKVDGRRVAVKNLLTALTS